MTIMNYLYEVSYLDYKLWDVKNLSVSDFTVQININKLMWANYKMRKEADPINTLPIDELI